MIEPVQDPFPDTPPTEEPTETTIPNTEATESIVVDVKGQVNVPGVYTLPTGSRVLDAIQMAGGLMPTAEEKSLNLAAKVIDEMVIYVHAIGETENPALFPDVPATRESQMSLVNINTANEDELMSLSGIGPSKAKAIITYREEKGFFQTTEDIKDVTGIGKQTFENLKDFISIK